MTISLLLYQPENEENLGSIARAASNFDFHNIYLIDPKCRVSEKSRWLAKHGLPTLENMKIVFSSQIEELLASFDVLVATHGRNSTGHNLIRTPITPRELSEKLKVIDDLHEKRIAILFGPEGEGLDKDLLSRCDIICAIPTSRDNPSMNLAASVTIFLYELSMLTGKQNKITINFRTMGAGERDALVAASGKTIDAMHWKTNISADNQKLVWRRMIGKSQLSKKECAVILGYLKNVNNNLEALEDLKNSDELKKKKR